MYWEATSAVHSMNSDTICKGLQHGKSEERKRMTFER